MFFLYLFRNKIIFNFVIFVASKKLERQIFSSSSFVAVVVSGIRDPGSGMDKSKDPGSATLVPVFSSSCYVPVRVVTVPI